MPFYTYLSASPLHLYLLICHSPTHSLPCHTKGYYNTLLANDTVMCALCPVGSVCVEAGTSLASLPLKAGYFHTLATRWLSLWPACSPEADFRARLCLGLPQASASLGHLAV